MNHVRIEQAKNGDPAVLVGAIRICSSYNPVKEAVRFLNGRIESVRRGATVIIIGAGLGYLDEELHRIRSDLRIIAFHLHPELRGLRTGGVSPAIRWYPDSGVPPAEFLFDHLKESEIAGLTVLEWPPSSKAMPETASDVSEAIASVVRRHSGNISTTAGFGRLWIRNMMRNFRDLRSYAEIRSLSGVTVIAASGPSLESAAEPLRRLRKHFNIWALPSSLAALARADIVPDMVFSTDPGFWATMHGRFLPEGVPLAMPLSAVPPVNPSTPVFLLSQDSPGERTLLSDFPPPPGTSTPVPQLGSVALSAIETWRRLSDNPLILAGLDLCWYDLQSHARPHPFDGWHAQFDRRTCPDMTSKWEMAVRRAPVSVKSVRTGSSLSTYADWFAGLGPNPGIYRISGERPGWKPPPLKGVTDTGTEILEKIGGSAEFAIRVRRRAGDGTARRSRVSDLLKYWMDRVKEIPDVPEDIADIAYTLDPGGVLDIARQNASTRPEVIGKHRQRILEILEHLAETNDR